MKATKKLVTLALVTLVSVVSVFAETTEKEDYADCEERYEQGREEIIVQLNTQEQLERFKSINEPLITNGYMKESDISVKVDWDYWDGRTAFPSFVSFSGDFSKCFAFDYVKKALQAENGGSYGYLMLQDGYEPGWDGSVGDSHLVYWFIWKNNAGTYLIVHIYITANIYDKK